jgi:hypothetical protein
MTTTPKHEPWTYVHFPKSDTLSIDRAYVKIGSKTRAELGGSDAEANARRIVACVNALKGIPTEALETGQIAEVIAVAKRATYFLQEIRAGNAYSEDKLWRETQVFERCFRRLSGDE